MAEPLRKSFNTKAYRKAIVASTIAISAAIAPQALLATPRIENLPEAQNSFQAFVQALHAPPEIIGNTVSIFNPLSVIEMWQRHGAPEEVITAISKLPADTQEDLKSRTEELFKNPDFKEVLIHMSAGKPDKLTQMLDSIANMSPDMELITLPYTRVPKEQNDAVWAEFQAQSEPAFYRYLAANHRDALKEAGFCDYGIQCFARGLAPTTEDGIPYNVDVDHVVERAGGGAMSTEKSVDPVLGGAPSYPINHISNLCLILRDLHVSKNTLNHAQNIGNTQPGETRALCMAAPATERRPVLVNSNALKPYMPGPTEAAFFATGPSLLLTNGMQSLSEDMQMSADLSARYFDTVFKDSFDHTAQLWDRITSSIEESVADGQVKNKDATSLRKTCDQYLAPLITVCTNMHVPPVELAKLHKISDRMDKAITMATTPAAQKGMEKNDRHGPA